MVFNVKCNSNSLKGLFQCHCGAYINPYILSRKLITQDGIFSVKHFSWSKAYCSLQYVLVFLVIHLSLAQAICNRDIAEMKKLFLSTVQEKWIQRQIVEYFIPFPSWNNLCSWTFFNVELTSNLQTTWVFINIAVVGRPSEDANY